MSEFEPLVVILSDSPDWREANEDLLRQLFGSDYITDADQ